jgi:hypothetical protein
VVFLRSLTSVGWGKGDSHPGEYLCVEFCPPVPVLVLWNMGAKQSTEKRALEVRVATWNLGTVFPTRFARPGGPLARTLAAAFWIPES